MIESMYLAFMGIAFLLLIVGLLLKSKDYLPAQLSLLFISLILFASLAMASAQVEVVHCGYNNVTSTTDGFNVTFTNERDCMTDTYFYKENMYIFGFLALVIGVMCLAVMLKFADFGRT